MNSSFFDQNRYLIYGATAIAVGVGVYYLTKEDSDIVQVFDPTVHTQAKLRQIMDEVFTESATLYCQKIRLIREMKKEGTFKGRDSVEMLLEKQQSEMQESENDTYKEYKVSEDLMVQWLRQF